MGAWVFVLAQATQAVAAQAPPPVDSTWDDVSRWVVVGVVTAFLAIVRSMMKSRDKADALQQERLKAIESALDELAKADTDRIVQTVQVVGDVTHTLQGLREDVQRMGSEVRRAAEDRTTQRAVLDAMNTRLTELVGDLKELKP